MTNRKLHMRFRLTPRSMTLDDLELILNDTYLSTYSITFSVSILNQLNWQSTLQLGLFMRQHRSSC